MQYKDKLYVAKEFTLGDYGEFSDQMALYTASKSMKERTPVMISVFMTAFGMTQEEAAAIPMRLATEGFQEILEANGVNLTKAPLQAKPEPASEDTISENQKAASA